MMKTVIPDDFASSRNWAADSRTWETDPAEEPPRPAPLSGAATISAGANGSSTLTVSGTQADINATLASLIYQGNLNYNGADTLTVVSTDSGPLSDTDTVGITVNPVNDAPVAVNDTFFLKSMYASGQLTTVPAAGVLANDTDADGYGDPGHQIAGSPTFLRVRLLGLGVGRAQGLQVGRSGGCRHALVSMSGQ